jgi:hypothetical protein
MGGLGDFLQFLPYVEKNKCNKKWYVVSHLNSAEIFFKGVGIVPESLRDIL